MGSVIPVVKIANQAYVLSVRSPQGKGNPLNLTTPATMGSEFLVGLMIGFTSQTTEIKISNGWKVSIGVILEATFMVGLKLKFIGEKLGALFHNSFK
jgi:hypothetical protein